MYTNISSPSSSYRTDLLSVKLDGRWMGERINSYDKAKQNIQLLAHAIYKNVGFVDIIELETFQHCDTMLLKITYDVGLVTLEDFMKKLEQQVLMNNI